VQGKTRRRQRALAHKRRSADRSVGQHEHDWLKDAEHVTASRAERAGVSWAEGRHAARMGSTTMLRIRVAYLGKSVLTRSRLVSATARCSQRRGTCLRRASHRQVPGGGEEARFVSYRSSRCKAVSQSGLSRDQFSADPFRNHLRRVHRASRARGEGRSSRAASPAVCTGTATSTATGSRQRRGRTFRSPRRRCTSAARKTLRVVCPLSDAVRAIVPNLRGVVDVADCGHWTQQERPDLVTTVLLDFLGGL
jgi:pimeloyl-ACP methyl ester carboxylesterase